MIVSDLDYLDQVENIDPESITGGFSISNGIGVAFIGLVEQNSTAFSAAASEEDATAIAIAKNESTITFGDVF
ncbi:MAG: hypothetical protein AAF383_07810 [Cyanobacteria bacterium P01_A01_bin.83]